MTNLEFFEEILGKNYDNLGFILSMPENSKGIIGRVYAEAASRNLLPVGFDEVLRFSERMQRQDKWGFVYIIRGTHEGVTRYKIGKANDMKDRLRVFSVKLPFDIETVIAFYVPKALEFEKRLHAEMSHKRLSGEWFDLGINEIFHLARLGMAEEFAACSTLMLEINSLIEKTKSIPAADYIEYLETMLVMHGVNFDRKEPSYE